MEEQENKSAEHNEEQAREEEVVAAPAAEAGEDNTTLMGILSYLGILVLVPLLSGAKKNPFVRYHLKQGLTLAALSLSIVVLSMVPVINLIMFFVGWILWLGVLIMAIMGIVNVVNKREKPLPILGQFADKVGSILSV